jgi:hypothetical protein
MMDLSSAAAAKLATKDKITVACPLCHIQVVSFLIVVNKLRRLILVSSKSNPHGSHKGVIMEPLCVVWKCLELAEANSL